MQIRFIVHSWAVKQISNVSAEERRRREHNDPEGQSQNNSYRVSIGAERKVIKDLWFTPTAGRNGGYNDGRNKGFVLSTFKWVFSAEPTIGK